MKLSSLLLLLLVLIVSSALGFNVPDVKTGDQPPNPPAPAANPPGTAPPAAPAPVPTAPAPAPAGSPPPAPSPPSPAGGTTVVNTAIMEHKLDELMTGMKERDHTLTEHKTAIGALAADVKVLLERSAVGVASKELKEVHSDLLRRFDTMLSQHVIVQQRLDALEKEIKTVQGSSRSWFWSLVFFIILMWVVSVLYNMYQERAKRKMF